MPSDPGDATAGRTALPALLPVQAAVAGVAVLGLDHAALQWAGDRAREYGGDLPQAPGPNAPVFFAVATIIFAAVAVWLWRRPGPGSAFAAGLLAPPYIAGLVMIAVAAVQRDDGALPQWYTLGRPALFGAVLVAYLAACVAVVRRSGRAIRSIRPASRKALLVLRVPALLGVPIVAITLVAVGQAGGLARQAAQASPGYYTGAGEFYLKNAVSAARTDAVMLAVVCAAVLLLAAALRRHGVTPALAAGLGVVTPPWLLLLLWVSAATPFVLSGASGEPVPEVLVDGPGWYLPALITQTSLAAVGCLASAALLLRTPKTARRPR